MESYFTSDFFIGNRQHLKKVFAGNAPIILTANGLMQKSADTAFPFRQDSNFWYLTGINEPDIILVIDRDKEYLIVPERDTIREYFDGALKAEELAGRSGVEEVLDANSGWKKLSSRLKRVKTAATIAAPPAYVAHYDFYANPAKATLISKLKEYNPSLEVLDLKDQFARLRMIKQPAELEALQSGIDTTVAAFEKLSRELKGMEHERQVEAFITQAFLSAGARHGYDPIVGGGVNACTLHYMANNCRLAGRELVLVDAGAERELYSADITRTYGMSRPGKRQQAVHRAVLEAQDYGLTLIKPGATIKENEKKMEQFIGEKLRSLGLIDEIEKETVRKYYPHALSHYLGLDVHDLGDYTAPLKPGMVLTVEPGIYIPEEGIGVRIEDDVLVTDTGVKVLSAGLPRELS